MFFIWTLSPLRFNTYLHPQKKKKVKNLLHFHFVHYKKLKIVYSKTQKKSIIELLKILAW